MRIIFPVLLLATLLCSCTPKQKYTVEGNIEGLKGTVYLFDKRGLADSTEAVDGRFQFEGDVEPGAKHVLTDTRHGDPTRLGVLFYVESGTIHVTDGEGRDSASVRVWGTPANDAANALTVMFQPLKEAAKQENITVLQKDSILRAAFQLEYDILRENRNNGFGITVLRKLRDELSPQEMLNECEFFGPDMLFSEELLELKEELRVQFDASDYINIMQGDPQGQIVTLTSVVDNPANKYTLVEFWSSASKACIAEISTLKRTYDAFHDKGFEIYAVSLDTVERDWLAAIDGYHLDWINVSDLNGANNVACKDYGITTIPSNFLIDSQGKIVAQKLHGSRLYVRIESLLGECMDDELKVVVNDDF